MKSLLTAVTLALTLGGCAAQTPPAVTTAPCPAPPFAPAVFPVLVPVGWNIVRLPVMVGDEIVTFQIMFNPDVSTLDWPVAISGVVAEPEGIPL